MADDVEMTDAQQHSQEEPNLRIQFMSDLHLEFPLAFQNLENVFESSYNHGFADFPVKGDIMCLLGDIGSPWKNSYKDFIYLMAEKFPLVLVIPGNHEYYSTRQTPCTYQSTQKKIQEICASSPRNNVIFGHKTSLLLKGVRILATCLWTNVPPESEAAVSKGLTDYHVIKIEEEQETEKIKRKATVKDTNEWHEEQVSWLEEELEKGKKKREKVVVMTHHAPTFMRTSHPRFNNDALQPAFATNLEGLLCSPLCVWLFGHTHYNDPYYFKNNNNNNNNNNKILISSNQMGYFAKGEKSATFSTKYCLKIDKDGVKEERE